MHNEPPEGFPLEKMSGKKIPPQFVEELLAAGYGDWRYTPPSEGGGPSFGSFFLSLQEMEQMGEEERIRLGVQTFYEFALAHRTQEPPAQDQPE